MTDAVILAAGMGSRMNVDGREERIFKPFIEVGGRAIVARNLGILAEHGVERVHVVLGFEHAELRARFEALPDLGLELNFVMNDEWMKSNGLSLLVTREELHGPFLLLMGDHLIDPSIISGLLNAGYQDFGVVLAVDQKIAEVFDLDDATKVMTETGDPWTRRRIANIGKTIPDYDCIDTGVFLCSTEVFAALQQARDKSDNDDCSLSEGMALLGRHGRFLAHDVGAARWQDVDTPDMMGNALEWFGAEPDLAPVAKPAPAPLHERVSKGDVRACARLLRWIDDKAPEVDAQLKQVYRRTGGAYVLGVTGNPGSGKSTLTSALIGRFVAQGMKVGVLAVDPSSPFTGGAILGDRIRMQEHAGNPDVFIRSLATRGFLGGLSKATNDSIFVLDAYGCDVIIVETVGVGQDEVDIVNCADTSLVVMVPGLGDEIQAIKAGILEIADIFVINKADRDGADKVHANLRGLQELVCGSVSRTPQIVKTSAIKGEGIDALMDEIEAHREWLRESGEGQKRRERFLKQTVFRHVQHHLMAEIEARMDQDERFAGALEQLLARTMDPFTLSDEVLAHIRSRSEADRLARAESSPAPERARPDPATTTG